MDEDDASLDDESLRWDQHRLIDGTFSVQVTHLPTGVSVYRRYDANTAVQPMLSEIRSELLTKLSADAS